MKKFLLLVGASLTFLSCDKKQHCYECDTIGNGSYHDMGCYTKDDWNSQTITDVSGQPIDKKTRCREK